MPKKTVRDKCNIKSKTNIKTQLQTMKAYQKLVKMKYNNNLPILGHSIPVQVSSKTQKLPKQLPNRMLLLHQQRKNKSKEILKNKYNHLPKDSKIPRKWCLVPGMIIMSNQSKPKSKEKSNRRRLLPLKKLNKYKSRKSKTKFKMKQTKNQKLKER